MSTIKYLEDSILVAGREPQDSEALTLLSENPEAALDLIYGPRRIVGAVPPHDHEEDGGESLLLPILSHSWGSYTQSSIRQMGCPLPIPSGPSYESTTEEGIFDATRGKRLLCCAGVIPGGVSQLRITLVERATNSGLFAGLAFTIRHLSSVNYRLSVAPEEVRADLSYITDSAPVRVHTVDVSDLTSLGDVTLDREVEFALWITSDLSNSLGDLHLLLHWEVRALAFTDRSREIAKGDRAFPQIAARELKSGYGLLGEPLANKIKETYNGLNVALWGNTPGLAYEGTPDRRRRYRESVETCHQHLGVLVPTEEGRVYSDGACLKDTQSFAYVTYLGETLPITAGNPVVADSRPNQGAFLHFTEDLSVGHVRYNFRRSIPAGCGALVFRFGLHPGREAANGVFDTSQGLYVSIEITPIGGGASIVHRLSSAPFFSPLDATQDDFGYVEVLPQDDVGYVSTGSLVLHGRKAWNRGAEITQSEQEAAQLNSVLYRVSRPVIAQLTYPPARPTDPYRETQDYDVKVRFQVRKQDLTVDSEAGCVWMMCYSEPGY